MAEATKQLAPHRQAIWNAALIGAPTAFLSHLALVTLLFEYRRLLAASSNIFLWIESLVAVGIAILATRGLAADDARRKSVSLLALALIFNSLAHLSWTAFVLVQGSPPSPSPADAMTLAFYGSFAAGLMLHPAVVSRSFVPVKLILELVAAFLATSLFFWVFSVGPLVSEGFSSRVAWPVALMYPASAAALFAALIFLLRRQSPRASRPTLKLLALGGAARLLTDAAFSYQVVRGTYVDGGYVDLGYTLTLVFFALAAVRTITGTTDRTLAWEMGAQEPEEAFAARGNFWLPHLGLMVAYVLILWTHFNPEAVDFTVAAVIFGGIIVLLTAREVVAARENESLYRRQSELTEVLRHARDGLEHRVEERTCELEEANEALAQEVAQHRRTEAKLEATNHTLELEASELKHARAELQSSLTEKEVLLKEVHHRVKNNLQVVSSLLALQSRATMDASAKLALLESQARIRAMSLIHQKLYSSTDLARIDFGDYLQNLVEHLFGIYNANPATIGLQMEVAPVRLNIDTAVPCGLIVNELISNALEHAFPGDRRGTIHVHLGQHEDGRLEVCVADDGVGLPADLDIRSTRSLGLQLITTLASQLEGELRVDQEAGTAFCLSFRPCEP